MNSKAQMLRARFGNHGINERAWRTLAHERARSFKQQRVGLKSHCLEAVHAGRSGMEPIGRWLLWAAGSFPARAVLVFCSGMVGVSIEAENDWGCVEGGTRGGLLCKTLAEAPVVVLASGSFEATALGFGAAHDTAGTREVGDTEVEEDREVRGQIAWRETEVCGVKRAATVCLDSHVCAGA